MKNQTSVCLPTVCSEMFQKKVLHGFWSVPEQSSVLIRKMRRYFDKGEQADYFYALLKGNVSIISYMPSGKVNALYHVASGALIGEHYSSNLDTNGRVYWYEAVACEPVEVLAVPWQYLYGFCDKACDHHKQLIQNLYESMSTKEWMAVRKLNVLGFASVQERIAAWLLQEADSGDTVVLKTNREEQADYLCVARPSLSRTLMQMQKAGLIEADRKQIRILDREKLEKFCKKEKFVTAVTDFF